MTRSAPLSILVIKTSSIGDVILTTPVAEALRKSYPDSHITWLAEDKVADVILGNPFVDEVIVWERRRMRELRKARRWRDLIRAMAGLRAEISNRTFDYCLDLQGFDRTLLIHLFVRARRRVVLPPEDRWHGYTKQIWRRLPRQHAVDYHLGVVRAAGLKLGDTAPPMRVVFSQADEEAAARLLAPLDGRRPLVAINPVSTWASKQWDSANYVELASRLIHNLQAGVVLIGGKGEAQVCNEVADLVGPGALGVAGETSLKELAALLTRCDCLVTSDSGPMHLAVAVGTPVVALFGPTDPANYGPRGPQHTVIYRGLPCSPCMNKHFVNPSCMAGIEVDEVFERVRARIAPGARPNLISVSDLVGSPHAAIPGLEG